MNRDPRGAYLGCERCGGWEFVSYTCDGKCSVADAGPHVHHEPCPDCSADKGYHSNWISEVPRSKDQLQDQLVEIHIKEQVSS